MVQRYLAIVAILKEDIDFDSDPDYDPDIYTDPDAEYARHYDPRYGALEEGWDSEPERSERRIQTARQLESFRTQKQEEWPRYNSRTALSNHYQDSLGWDPDDQTSVNRRFFNFG